MVRGNPPYSESQEMYVVVHITWKEKESNTYILVSQSLIGRQLVRNKERIRLKYW